MTRETPRRAYFEDGSIIEAKRGKKSWERTVRIFRDDDPRPMKVWFRPCDDWLKAYDRYWGERGLR